MAFILRCLCPGYCKYGQDLKMKINKVSILIFFCFLVCLGQCTSTEYARDPAKKGFFLAENMIRQKRYYGGLLMHRINASFFQEYPYGKKSFARLQELNAILKKSIEGRPPVEIIQEKSKIKNQQVYLTIVNNTKKQVQNARIEIEFLTQNNRTIPNPTTGNKSMQRQLSRPIGPWGVYVDRFALTGYPGVYSFRAKIVSHTLKDLKIE